MSKILLFSAMFYRSSNVLSDQIDCTYKDRQERKGELWIYILNSKFTFLLLDWVSFFGPESLILLFCCSCFLFDPEFSIHIFVARVSFLTLGFGSWGVRLGIPWDSHTNLVPLPDTTWLFLIFSQKIFVSFKIKYLAAKKWYD